MLLRLLRIVLAFALGCFAASMTMVLFVFTPSEILGLPPDVRADRLGKAIQLATYAAVQIALFAAPLAFVTTAIGEMLGKRGWSYYALSGLVVAGLGFFAQRTTEQIGQPTIANNYALTAFLLAGFIGGLVYWIVGGRFAGRSVQITRPLAGGASQSDAGTGSKSAPERPSQSFEPNKV